MVSLSTRHVFMLFVLAPCIGSKRINYSVDQARMEASRAAGAMVAVGAIDRLAKMSLCSAPVVQQLHVNAR